jgi:hypothetical protein
MTEELEVAAQIAAAFDGIGIAYFIGGSLASSIQGDPRATNDIDLFFARDEPFDREELARRRSVSIEGKTLMVKTPEDTVLRKLVWYRAGSEISERQWKDVLGVLRQSGALLDRAYLDAWAARLGVDDLLARAWAAI